MSTTLNWAADGLLQAGGRTSLNMATRGHLGTAGGAVLITGSESIALPLIENAQLPLVVITPSGEILPCQLIEAIPGAVVVSTVNGEILALPLEEATTSTIFVHVDDEALPLTLQELTASTLIVRVVEVETVGLVEQNATTAFLTSDGELLPCLLIESIALPQIATLSGESMALQAIENSQSLLFVQVDEAWAARLTERVRASVLIVTSDPGVAIGLLNEKTLAVLLTTEGDTFPLRLIEMIILPEIDVLTADPLPLHLFESTRAFISVSVDGQVAVGVDEQFVASVSFTGLGDILPLALTVQSVPVVLIRDGDDLPCLLVEAFSLPQIDVLTADSLRANLEESTKAKIFVQLTDLGLRIGLLDQPKAHVSFTVEGDVLPYQLLDAGAYYDVYIPGQETWRVALEIGELKVVITHVPDPPSLYLNMPGQWADQLHTAPATSKPIVHDTGAPLDLPVTFGDFDN